MLQWLLDFFRRTPRATWGTASRRTAHLAESTAWFLGLAELLVVGWQIMKFVAAFLLSLAIAIAVPAFGVIVMRIPFPWWVLVPWGLITFVASLDGFKKAWWS